MTGIVVQESLGMEISSSGWPVISSENNRNGSFSVHCLVDRYIDKTSEFLQKPFEMFFSEIISSEIISSEIISSEIFGF